MSFIVCFRVDTKDDCIVILAPRQLIKLWLIKLLENITAG